MAIPTYQEMFVPMLKVIAKNGPMGIRDCYELVADHFGLTSEDRSQLLPSGQLRAYNRVQWAKVDLLNAGLVEAPERGIVKITPRGLAELNDGPEQMDRKYLTKYPEFAEFIKPKKSKPKDESDVSDNDDASEDDTPEERMESAYGDLRESLASDLINSVKSASPEFFERLVVKLLVAMGYGGSLRDAGSVVGKSGDEGIDGIIKEDALGLDQIYIQAKRWENVVSRPEIQKFVGALQGKRAKKGVFITTSRFSAEAREYAKILDAKVILIDGDDLSQLMIDYDVGVSSSVVYEIKKIDTDFFDEN